MAKDTGRGADTFFGQTSRPRRPAKPMNVTSKRPIKSEPVRPKKRIRTTITLSPQDEERLELLRLRLRRDSGRGLTYSNVVSQALQTLADAVRIPSLSESET